MDKLDRLGSVQWPCNDAAPEGTPIMHVDKFVRGKGRFMITEYVPTDERTGPHPGEREHGAAGRGTRGEGGSACESRAERGWRGRARWRERARWRACEPGAA